jgi:nitrogen fixation protein FixH
LTAKLTGRGVLVWLAAFFGVILATNIYFVTLSVKTFSGEDEADPYLQGVEYNETLAHRAAQARIGWRAQISSERLPSGFLQITARIAQSNGRPEGGATLKGELRHLADANRDRTLVFREIESGTYVATLDGATHGGWEVLVSNTGTTPFEARSRIWVP